ncbi:MAG: hypothetical protein NZ959_10420 [Armatimonadetes bacterium]|nr:hypothetical protein [Armatimonadota bacterium]MDW8122709.1 hypothetical protein [Armatimonadota bacterium]
MPIRVKVRTLWRHSENTDASFHSTTVDAFTDYRQTAHPDSPPSGKLRLFADETDGKLKIKKPDGSLAVLDHHALLDATVHPDSAPTTVQRGMLIVGRLIGAAIKWAGLALGAAGKVLKSDGTDVTWGNVDWTEVTNKPSTFPPSPHSHPLSDWQQSGAAPQQIPKWSGTQWQPGNVDWTEVTNKPATFPPDPHTHPLTQIQQSGATTNQVPKWSGTQWQAGNVDWAEVVNKPSLFNAGQIQSRDVSAAAPSDGQFLGWDASANQWLPRTGLRRRRAQSQQFYMEGCQTGSGVIAVGMALVATSGSAVTATLANTRLAGMQTAATSGSTAMRYGNSSLRPVITSLISGCAVVTDTTNVRYFVGLASGAIGNIVASDTGANNTHTIGFIKRSTDTNWFLVVNNGAATPTYVDTGIAVTTNTPLYWSLTRVGDTSWQWSLQQGNNLASGTTTLGPSPTVDTTLYAGAVGTTEAVAKTIYHPWVYGELTPDF